MRELELWIDIPDLLPLRIPPDHTVNNGRLASFRVSVVLAYRIDLDVLHVIYIDELLVDIGAVGTWMTKGRIDFTGLISNLFSL